MTDQTPHAGCAHESFHTLAEIGRLSSEEGGPITHYSAEFTVLCQDCGEEFCFHGAPLGLDPYHPSANPDRTRLRCPIMPAGQALPDNLLGYTITLGAPSERELEARGILAMLAQRSPEQQVVYLTTLLTERDKTKRRA